MTKRTLPPPEIPEQPLDESRLAALAEGAVRAALRELAALPVETRDRQVHVLLPNGSETRMLPGPDYHKVMLR